MHYQDFYSTLDTLLIMIPFIAMMAIGMFRLDEHFAAPKEARQRRRSFCGVDGNGRPWLSDPDGRPCRPGRASK